MNSFEIGTLISHNRYHRIYLRGAGFPEPAKVSSAERRLAAEQNRRHVAHAAKRRTGK